MIILTSTKDEKVKVASKRYSSQRKNYLAPNIRVAIQKGKCRCFQLLQSRRVQFNLPKYLHSHSYNNDLQLTLNFENGKSRRSLQNYSFLKNDSGINFSAKLFIEQSKSWIPAKLHCDNHSSIKIISRPSNMNLDISLSTIETIKVQQFMIEILFYQL